MLFKIFLYCLVASLALAEDSNDPATVMPPQVRVEKSVSFVTAHKNPDVLEDDAFHTAHKIAHYEVENMNILPTKEKPELNPILSALINEDVMKSIEAKRAIEEAELEIIKAEIDAAVKAEEKKIGESKTEATEAKDLVVEEEKATEMPINILTTIAPVKKSQLDKDDEINVGFVDQAIALDAAGNEVVKKSRIEIKKGPNGQDYEYEYVYYYEDEEDDEKTKEDSVADGEKAETRGKSRYTNIERSTAATPADNSLVSGKAKGRSSNVEEAFETERLPLNTRFPSRGKAVDVPPTPALDSTDSAAERKKISVKRPSLELVDSETFNTDEKQAKSSRNSDDTKSAITIEQEMAVLASAQAAAAAAKDAEEAAEAAKAKEKKDEESADNNDEVEQTTPAMEKAALDLYALLTNENNNMDLTTNSDMDVTTLAPDTTDKYGEDLLTTMVDEEPSSTTTTTTTTTTPKPTTTTTTTTSTTTTTPAPSLYGGRRGGVTTGRNRFKLKSATGPTTSTTTEAPTEAPRSKNRYSRPSIGGRSRPGARTTATPAHAEEPQHEEEIAVKEVKPVSSGFPRNRPRNRFNIRGSTTTTEAPANDGSHEEETVSSTTARTLRGRPTLNLRGRSRTTTTKAPANEDDSVNDSDNSVDDKPSTAAPNHSGPVRPRFNLNRAGPNRLPGRPKLGRTTTEAPAAADTDDSAADSSHHNDVKGEGEGGEAAADKPAEEQASANVGGLNRLKNRPRLGGLHKTDSKPKVAPPPVAPRKINPLLANRRLKLGPSTTEAPVDEAPPAAEDSESKEEGATSQEESKDETTEELETTTKQQPRGLGLLGQRRRLPTRKPGTLL